MNDYCVKADPLCVRRLSCAVRIEYKISVLTRNVELTRFQDHQTMEGSIQANLLFEVVILTVFCIIPTCVHA